MLLFKDDFFYIWYKKLTLNKNLKFEAVYPIQKNFSKTKTFFFFGREILRFGKKFSLQKEFWSKNRKIKIEKKNNFVSVFCLLVLEKNFLYRVFDFNIFYLSNPFLDNNRKKIHFKESCKFYQYLFNTLNLIAKHHRYITNFSANTIKIFLKNYENLICYCFGLKKEKFFLKKINNTFLNS